jgi:hypothetical protein
MNRLAIVFSGLLSVFVTASAAQEPNNRINLDVVSNSPFFPPIVAARISFAERDSKCSEDRGTLRISGGTLTLIESSADFPRTNDGRSTISFIDDETQQYRIETADCRIDVAVREQVNRDGSWVSLLVPKLRRPSLPPEEARELQRQFMENLRTPKESTPSSRERLDRFAAAAKEMRAWSSPMGIIYHSLAFEDRPQACFEAAGDLRIERSAIQFLFLTGLPGDLNRFAIERTDLDMNRGRLYFTRGECRFELTATQSVLRDGEWISVPLAPAPPPKE